MRFVDAAELARILSFPELVEALKAGFRSKVTVPVRHHHPMPRGGEPDAMLLLMPAWSDASAGVADDAMIGLKVVSVIPGNAARGKASVVGAYLLASGVTGEPLAVMDGTALTLWRTAAASALAASYLANKQSSRLTIVGAGALSAFLLDAHASQHPIEEVRIWNRSLDKAEALAARSAGRGFKAVATADLEAAVGWADIISCATMSTEPLVRGAWLKPGAHLDLVGGYTPAMREADDEAIRRARVFVDTRASVLKEAGDITQPIQSGALTADGIIADLFELCRGERHGRSADNEITLFKSAGTAVEDLAAAQLVWAKINAVSTL